MSTPGQGQAMPGTRLISFVEATVEALREEMRRDGRIFYMGEGIGARGGNFRQTKGLYEEFGPLRVRDTPISELGFTGIGIGAAMAGMHPVVDLMFADFLAEAMSQLVHQAAKVHYLSAGRLSVPMVIRVAFGEVRSAGAHHSSCLYPWFLHQPGLKVVVPSNAADAKGLWTAALREQCPVIMFEHKRLYTSKGEVPASEYVLPFGKAAVVRAGTDVTVAAIGNMVSKSVAAAAVLEQEDVSAEVLDLRTLEPLDKGSILASVAKTGRLVIADEAFQACGAAAEIAAMVAQEGFRHLRSPIRRVATLAAPHPFSPPLEQAIVPGSERIAAAAREALNE